MKWNITYRFVASRPEEGGAFKCSVQTSRVLDGRIDARPALLHILSCLIQLNVYSVYTYPYTGARAVSNYMPGAIRLY